MGRGTGETLQGFGAIALGNVGKARAFWGETLENFGEKHEVQRGKLWASMGSTAVVLKKGYGDAAQEAKRRMLSWYGV